MVDEADNLPGNLPNNQASRVNTQGGWGSTLDREIKGPDRAIFTGFYKKFQQISYYDKQAVFDERKCLNIPRKILYKSRNAGATTSEVKEKNIDQMHRQISSLKVKFKEMEDRKSSYNVEEGDGIHRNAG